MAGYNITTSFEILQFLLYETLIQIFEFYTK